MANMGRIYGNIWSGLEIVIFNGSLNAWQMFAREETELSFNLTYMKFAVNLILHEDGKDMIIMTIKQHVESTHHRQVI